MSAFPKNDFAASRDSPSGGMNLMLLLPNPCRTRVLLNSYLYGPFPWKSSHRMANTLHESPPPKCWRIPDVEVNRFRTDGGIELKESDFPSWTVRTVFNIQNPWTLYVRSDLLTSNMDVSDSIVEGGLLVLQGIQVANFIEHISHRFATTCETNKLIITTRYGYHFNTVVLKSTKVFFPNDDRSSCWARTIFCLLSSFPCGVCIAATRGWMKDVVGQWIEHKPY